MKGPREKILYLLLIRFTFAFAILDFENADRYVCVALLILLTNNFGFKNGCEESFLPPQLK